MGLPVLVFESIIKGPGVMILKLPFVKNGETCQLLIARQKRAVLRLFPPGGNDKGAGGEHWVRVQTGNPAPAADVAEIPLIRH